MSLKSHPATEKRREKARREGNIAKGSSLSGIMALSAGFYALFLACSFGWLAPGMLIKSWYFTDFSRALAESQRTVLWALGITILCLAVGSVVGILVEYAQLGFRIYPGSGFRIQGRLSISSGFRSLGARLIQLWIPSLLGIVFGAVLYWFCAHALYDWVVEGFSREQLPIGEIGGMWGAAVVLGVVDIWIRRWLHERSLRMSHQDLVEEQKESEGDPHVRAHRQSLHRMLSLQSIEQRVKRSKVLIVERHKRS